MSRPATRAAVPPTAWHTISSAVTAALRRKRVNLISCARHPASRRIREQGRSTSAACKATPLFPGGDRQIAPAQIPSLPLPSRINDPSRESARWTFDKGRCVHTIAASGEREQFGLRPPAQILPADRQRAQALAGGGEDRVGDGGLDHGRARLADTAPSFAGRRRDVDLRL